MHIDWFLFNFSETDCKLIDAFFFFSSTMGNNVVSTFDDFIMLIL